MPRTEDVFPSQSFAKPDPTDDRHFYRVPRRVVHIDEGAIAYLRDEVYAEVLPPGGDVLDLMSSWRSHLPPGVAYGRVAGLGMNAEEMADNPQLTEHVVQNLNQQPQLPYPDAVFDAAVCAVSVQYLQQPVEVFAEVGRVLRPGAPFVVSFSNRCFPTKAVAVWAANNDAGHVAYVQRVFAAAGVFGAATARTHKAGPLSAFGLGGDPLYVVMAQRT